jgi:molecular chaperone DnaK (HSP70)
MSSEIALGIDFGTSTSEVAIVDQTEQPSSVQNSRGDFCTPSAICFENGEPAFVGLDALYESLVHPEKVAKHFKRDLGSKKVIFQGKKGLCATELTAIVIGDLRGNAERSTNTEAKHVVLSCPANFLDDSKQALLDAAKLAGLEADAIISEPAAAGLAYVYGKQFDRRFVVFDLGGGTLDVSIIEVAGNSITVVATDGVPKLGGVDFTARIEQFILDRFVKETKSSPSRDSDPLFFQEIFQKAEAAKLSLTQRDKATIVVSCKGHQSIVELTNAAFKSICKDLTGQCLKCTDKVVQDAGFAWKEIDGFLMVGGSSRMPHLQDDLASKTGLVPKMDIEPDRAVSWGAALKARMVLGEKGVLPHTNIFLREAAAHDLGCGVMKAGGTGEDDIVQSVIIPQNTPVPVQKSDRYFLQHEDQDSVRITILQGDGGKPKGECLEIGEIILEHLPKESKRTKRIEVVYMLDSNGMAQATATDLVGGATKTISIDCTKNIKKRSN